MTLQSATSATTEPEAPGGIVDPGVRRELRIAVTMNGGVSLAVYIGGVAHEFNRLTRGEAGYEDLLQKLGYAWKSPNSSPDGPVDVFPIIDVITGTSAGGINAAALALAQANVHGDLDLLKGLWIKHGQIGDLLREPFHAGPASVLKGDDYFYPQIRLAFRRLTESYDRSDHPHSDEQRVRPVDLTIPTTLLTPIESFSVDDLGTSMVQQEHAGLFYFRGGTSQPVSDDGRDDMFSADPLEDGEERDGKERRIIDETVEALALAARASAGFPAAFEPTFIPVRRKDNADGRPDMADYANWAHTGRDTDEEKELSRFAVDGGVLANTPTRPALAAIRRQEVTSTMVRRVLIIVHPHAEYARGLENVADDSGKPPTLVGTLSGVLRASGSVGSRTYVEEIQQHNDLALRWRDGRKAAMLEFDHQTLSRFLGQGTNQQAAWKIFRRLRLRRSAYVAAQQIRHEFSTPFAKLIEYAASVLEGMNDPDDLAFLPQNPPTAADFDQDEWRWGLQFAVGVTTQATDLLRQLINARTMIPIDQREAIENAANEAWKIAVNSGIKLDRHCRDEREDAASSQGQESAATNNGRSGAEQPPVPESTRIRQRLRTNLQIYAGHMLAQELPDRADSPTIDAVPPTRGAQSIGMVRGVASKPLGVVVERDGSPATGHNPTPSDGDDSTTGARQPSSRAGSAPETSTEATKPPRGAQTIGLVREVVGQLLLVIDKLDGVPPLDEDPGLGEAAGAGSRVELPVLLQRSNPLRHVEKVRNGTQVPDRERVEELIKRMVQIEIVSYLTAEQDVNEGLVPTAPIEYVQLSAYVNQHFASDFTSDDKLAGMSLNRFGAFLKRSWRANDWIWGRLDAVKILMLVVLTPEMIRGLANNRPAVEGESNKAIASDIVDGIARSTFSDNSDLYDELIASGAKPGPLQVLRDRAVDEVVRTLNRNDEPMTDLASLAAYGLQVVVAKDDVPWLAATIRDDDDDGATGVETAEFLNQLGGDTKSQLGENTKSRNGYELLTLFANSRIGQEALGKQMPSDLMIRTAATAAATAVTALSSDKAGLALARPATKAARGMIAVPYWVLIGLTSRGHIARGLASALLAIGVSLTALSLLTDLPGLVGKLVPTVGIASLLTVLVYAAMRTQSIVHGAALLGLFIPLVAYAVDGAVKNDSKVVDETTVGLICLLLLLIWVIVIANFAPHTRSPLGTLLTVIDAVKSFVIRHWARLVSATVVVVAIAVSAYHWRDVVTRLYERSGLRGFVSTFVLEFHSSPWNGDVRSWMTILLIGALLMGCATAWRKSNWFRPSRRNGLPKRARLADPAGLATAWSPVYGFIYLAMGCALVPLLGADPPRWATIASITSLVLGLFFSLIAVNLIPYRRERRLVRTLAAHFDSAKVPENPKELIAAFDSMGELSSYLTKNGCDAELSRHGKRVRRRANRVVKARRSARTAATKVK